MEPITIITTAFITACKNLAPNVVKDAYNALKALILKTAVSG